MPACSKSHFWPICRLYFRRCRLAAWLLILALLGALVYLNQVGLPGFVKKPLLEKLRARGIDLQFSRLRLDFALGIVADNVRFGGADKPSSPQLTLAEVTVQLNPKALSRLQVQLDGVTLRQGRLVWPLPSTNSAPRHLSVEDIHTRLRFLPGDEWSLDDFTARFAGANIQMSGSVANASAVRTWKFLQPGATPGFAWQNRLGEFADLLERIHFSIPPQLQLEVRGDALDLQSFQVRLSVRTPDADTPWGTLTEGRLDARLFASTTNKLSRAEVSLQAAEAKTPWATAINLRLEARLGSLRGLTNPANAQVTLTAQEARTRWASVTQLQLQLHLAPEPNQTNLLNGDLALQAQRADFEWGNAFNPRVTAQWTQALTNAIPISGQGRLHCEQAASEWGGATNIDLLATVATNSELSTLDPLDSHSTNAPLLRDSNSPPLDWEFRLGAIESPKLEAQAIDCSGRWRAPELAITNLRARVYHGNLAASAALDVATRALKVSLSSDVDPHELEPLLREPARHLLEQATWHLPPKVEAKASLILPAWTNRQPDWRAQVQPTLRLQGEINLERGGAFRTVPVAAFHSHFSYSNLLWRLPDLTVRRPEGRIEAFHESGEQAYYWRIHSTVDVNSLRPLLQTNGQRGLDLFSFSRPPVIDVELRGRGGDFDHLGAQGRVALTNFTFRGQSFASFDSALQYSNLFLQLTAPQIQRGSNEQLRATALGVDFRTQKIYMTNGFSTADPVAVTRAISPVVARAMEPYQFGAPPTVRANGIIPIRSEDDADLYFDVAGGHFHWTKFNVRQIAGSIHWVGQHLTISNVQTEFYGGQASGALRVDFHPHAEAEYGFNFTTANTQLQRLMADLITQSNKLEGRLSGTLVITEANVGAWRKTDGFGNLDLRDGLIWDIPLFGAFSEVLNGLVPGLGNSRASAGTCTFSITNGVIFSDDLVIRSPAMRLQYRGTVDLTGQVNARVEAGLLHDMWLVGPVVSTVFWPVTKLFEYHVTGPLAQPKKEPLYLISKMVLLPFHPFRTLKELIPEEPKPPPFRQD